MTPVALRSAALVLCLSLPGGAQAQDGPSGTPQPDRSVRDREFGVVARHYGLERRVEMLQWTRAPDGYARTWSELPIDSAGFAGGYRNPVAFPLQSRRWTASMITIDGKPLDPSVVQELGEWRVFRPSFSALPANLAATFQPEGDGLGSADNPLDPHVGDLRIHWRELVLPPLDDRIALRGGRWQLIAQTQASDASPVAMSVRAEVAPATGSRRSWWLGGAVVGFVAFLAAIGAGVLRRRKRISNR